MNRNKRYRWASLAVVLLACGKPPKTTADVDTMREASFVKDIKDEPRPPPEPPRKTEDRAPAPTASGPSPVLVEKSNVMEPEVETPPIEKGPTKKPTGRERITKTECTRVFDRFFALVLESDPRFKDVGPEGRSMVRQMAAQDSQLLALQKDCETDVSRSKYNCAMAAKTSFGWQTCLK